MDRYVVLFRPVHKFQIEVQKPMMAKHQPFP